MPPNISFDSFRDIILYETIKGMEKIAAESAGRLAATIDRSLCKNILKSSSKTIRDYHNPNIPDGSFKILCQASLDSVLLDTNRVTRAKEFVDYPRFLTMLENIIERVDSQILRPRQQK